MILPSVFHCFGNFCVHQNIIKQNLFYTRGDAGILNEGLPLG